MAGLILASRSPQRRAILQQLGVAFAAVAPDVEELVEGDPEAIAAENARRKARAVAGAGPDEPAGAGPDEPAGAGPDEPAGAGPDEPAGVGPEEPVLGVDTVVCIGARMYDKPRDLVEARSTLKALSGRAHTVISGICLIDHAGEQSATASTSVEFRELTPRLVDWYLSSGEWRERAGGYAIQGRGAALVRRVEGDYLNVVGLPVAQLLELAPWLLTGPST